MAEDAITLQGTGEAPKEQGSSLLHTIRDWALMRDVQVGALLILMCLAAFPVTSKAMLESWVDLDGYYQHGLLVPFAVGYILWMRREKLAALPNKPTIWPAPLLIGLLYLGHVSTKAGLVFGALAAMMLLTGLVGVWMIFGFKQSLAMAPGTLYASLGMPLFFQFIDRTTNVFQLWSTAGSYYLLKLTGLDPYKESSTVIQLNNFRLEVAVACSGMKMTLAIVAAAVFLVLIAGLKWWKNLILVLMAVPYAIFVNTIRIAIIGVIGETMGSEAGFWFHDYGSYLVLAVAFYGLYKVTQWMGWKV